LTGGIRRRERSDLPHTWERVKLLLILSGGEIPGVLGKGEEGGESILIPGKETQTSFNCNHGSRVERGNFFSGRRGKDPPDTHEKKFSERRGEKENQHSVFSFEGKGRAFLGVEDKEGKKKSILTIH